MGLEDKFNITGVCLVGCGHAVHASVALFNYYGIDNVTVFSDFSDEIQRFKEGMRSNGGEITATFAEHLKPAGLLKGVPKCVTNNADEALEGVNVIVMPLPSFAYEGVFQSLKPHLKPGMVVCVTPGQGGVEWVAKKVLGKELYESLIIFALSPMPFNCRVSEFGKHVNVQAFKTDYWVFTSPVSAASVAVSVTKQLYGGIDVSDRGHIISAALMPLNANIHPQRLYSMLKDYKTGEVLKANPLFYEEMTEEATELMRQTSDELAKISAALKSNGVPCNIPSILEAETFTWPHGLKENCPKTLLQIFRQNPNYKGFTCPFIGDSAGGWKPDFTNRYFAEDIPLGLCIFKGVAEIVGVQTPVIDAIIVWAQKHMGKMYINPEDGTFSGKDVEFTYAPQRFGFNTVEDLL